MVKLPNTIANGVLVLVSVLVAVVASLAAIELYLRLHFETGETHQLRDMTEFHPTRGWRLVPGKYQHYDANAMTFSRIEINTLGIRGNEVPLKCSTDRERVTLIGDSFMFGLALDEGDTVADRVQAALGRGYEIVNLGVPGYGTGQEILFLEELRAKGYEFGSHVILAFFTNDIQDNLGLDYGTQARQAHKPAFSIGPDGTLIVDKPRGAENRSSNTERARHSNQYLFDDFLISRAGLLAARFPFLVRTLASVGINISLPRDPGIITGWYSDGWEMRWHVTDRLISYMADLVEANDTGVDIVFIPSPFQVEPTFREIVSSHALHDERYKAFLADIDRPQRMLMALCEQRKLRCVDTTDELRHASAMQPTFFLREGHLNAFGVSVVSRAFKEHVETQRSVKPTEAAPRAEPR